MEHAWKKGGQSLVAARVASRKKDSGLGKNVELPRTPTLQGPGIEDLEHDLEEGVRLMTRAEDERIHMRDCRNTIALLDAVRKGRLQASTAALRAGYFGGEGCIAQLVFMGTGTVSLLASLSWLLLTLFDPVHWSVVTFFRGGWWCFIPLSTPIFLRGWYLRKLELLNKRSASVDALNEEERIGRRAANSLTVTCFGLGVTLLWVVSHYISLGGKMDLSPFLPEQNHAFVIYAGVAVVPVIVLLFRTGWLLHLGQLKRGQFMAYLVYGACGAAFIGASAVVSGPLVSFPRALFIFSGLSLWGLAVTVWWILVSRKRKAVTKELLEDMERYDAAWAAIRADPRQRAALEGIEVLVATHGASLRKAHGNPVANSCFLNVKARKTRDQLLIMITQAWGLNDKFQRIAATWRPQTGTGGAEKEQSDLQGLLPKRRARAIEKVWRAYGGDATRLRDLVRCSLVFDDTADLARCLEVIFADRRVRVSQVKNRFEGAYNARAETCGYRDVQLKVTLTEGDEGAFTQEDLDTGLHEHVCEVQLHLKSIYELKNNEGHKRYVEFRNRMAE
jgi:hypothetical protein